MDDMFSSFNAVCKQIKTHILNLRTGKTVKLKEVDSVYFKPVLHEDLLEALSRVNIPEINKALPLDTWEKPIYVYGSRYYQYIRLINELTDKVKKGHTLTRKEISSPRTNVDVGDFFISEDGFFSTPDEVLPQLLGCFEEFAKAVETSHASVDKSPTIKHNLRLSEPIIADMIDFVENLRIDLSHVSTYPERHSRRRTGRNMENDPR